MAPQTPYAVRPPLGRTWQLIALALWVGVGAVWSALAAGDDAAVDPSLPVLRSMREVWHAPQDQREKLHRIEIEFQATYFDPHWKLMWVSNDGSPLFVPLGTSAPDIRTGDVFRVEGTYRPLDAFTLSNFSIRVVQRDQPLTPYLIPGAIADAHRLDAHVIRTTALIERQFETDPTHLEYRAIIGGRQVQVRLLIDPTAPAPLLSGKIATVEGVFVPTRDQNAESFAELWIGRTTQVSDVRQLAEHEGFKRTAAVISQIESRTIREAVVLSGSVSDFKPGRGFTLVDPTGRIHVATAQTAFVEDGADVEVYGEPTPTRDGWQISYPLVRPKGQAAANAVVETRAIAPTSLPTLRTLREFWSVDPSLKENLHQFDITLRVQYHDPDWALLWADDGTDRTFIAADRKDVYFASGRVIRLQGVIKPSEPLSLGAASTIDTVHVYQAIDPVQITDDIATRSDLDSHTVRVTGLVENQVEIDPTHTLLSMVVDGHRVEARSRLANSDVLLGLDGHLVSVEGVFVPRASSTGPFVADLWIGRMASVRTISRLDSDPLFNLDVTPIESLAECSPETMVRVKGTIHAITPGRSIEMRDSTGHLHLRTAQSAGLAVGTVVEVRGYPAKSGSEWTLTRPLLRPSDGPAGAAVASVAPGVIYRMTDQVISLPLAEAQQDRPVRIRGTVTWSHADSPVLFVRDSTGGLEVVRPDPTVAPPAAGTSVTITGTTTVGPYAPRIAATRIEGFGTETLPDPRLVTLEQAMTGIEEAQRIELQGYVRDVTHEHPWTTMTLVASGGEFTAVFPEDPQLHVYHRATVSVIGVCSADANDNRQLTGIRLRVRSSGDIRALRPAPADVFAASRRHIGDLRQFSGRQAFGNRILIQGTVLLHSPGRFVVVDDGTGGIVAYARGPDTFKPGTAIEVAGLLGFDGPRTVLREAFCREAGSPGRIIPVVVNSPETIRESRENRLVRVEGMLLSIVEVETELRLKMERDGTSFDAIFDGTIARELLPRPGSRIRVTGVYQINYDEKNQPQRFSVRMRTTGDIDILAQPSWFTMVHALWMAGGLAVVVTLAFAWVYLLRMRVRRQTGQIREQLVKEARLEDRQRNIIEKASDFIFMLDLSGNFTLFNPAGEAMTGYTREDVPRLTIYDLIDENDRIGLRTSLLKARPGSEIQPFQSQFRRKDGTLIWVEVAIRFLVEEDRVTGALCVARDITERKRVEEELKRARDAAEANTQAKSAFLANMSHEIRTPMNGVIGMSNLLLDTPLNHDQRDFALTIRNSAEALLTVLNDILDFSKIEAGKLQFETLDFDLTETIDDTLDLLAARAASKQLELAALIPTTLPQKLRGDPGRLRQVLLNLIGNAIKFTENGDVSVSVSLDRETRTGYQLRFEVKDTGIGISQEQQDRLFMPFSQADASTTRRYGGTGLGLAICRQIVEQMHGQIGVRSEQGRGSTFWFTLEFARGSEAPLDPPPGALRGLRVLGVDDNQVNRLVLQHYLESSGARLDLAADGSEALGMLRAAATAGDPFRLVLLDYHMPEMDGIALAHAIRADSRLRGLPMALLTSVDRRFTPEELAAIGIAASMAKPIRQRELMHTIQRALHPEQASPASETRAPAGDSPSMPPLRVLIAEDNPVNQRLTRIQLKKLGYEADLACNGLEVLEAFERVNYDVIFMDCQMPELDGYETARRLATHARRQEVRIVAMTANAMQGDRDKCLESGMDDYLSKPTRPDDLANALRRAAEAIERPV